MQAIAGRIILLDGWRRAGLAFLAGLVATFALAPYDLPLVGFVSFPILVWLIDGAVAEPGRGLLRRLAPAFRVGWCFGFGYFLGGLWWLGAAILVDAAEFWWALPFAVLGLPAVLAFYHGLAAALARLLWSDGGGRILALAFAFSLAEFARSALLTGFTWNQIGMMAAPSPLMMQTLGLVGLHGLTLAAVVVFAAPAMLVGDRYARGAVAALALVLAVGHLGYGAYRMAQEPAGFVPDVALRIVQPNILQSQKWDAEEAERIFARHLELSADRTGEDAGTAETLVVWPESAFPFILTDQPDAIARLSGTLVAGETLLAGAARAEGERGAERLFYNSLLVVAQDGTIADARDKVHLVPFGEYLPFQAELETLGISQLTQLPGGFSAGMDRSPVTLASGLSFLSLICYEIIFQDEIDAGEDDGRPGFLLNVTNDAWYGRTPGPYQHARHAQASAVTVGLPLVRAANTGISVVTDAKGREIAGLDLGEAGVVRSQLPVAGEPTIFTRLRNVPFLLALVTAAVGAVALRHLGSRSLRFPER